MKLIILILLFSKVTFAGDKYKQVMNNCLKRKNWAEVKCNVKDLPEEEGYHETFMGTYSINVLTVLLEVYDEILDIGQVYLNIPYISSGDSEHLLDRPELKKAAYKTAILDFRKRNQNLNGCQRACVVKCVTSNLLDFDEIASTKFGRVEDMIDKELGECTEYARVAQFVGRHMGVHTELVGSSVHAFVGFRINGERYFSEPQEPECNFFSPRKSTSEELKELESNINQKDRARQTFDTPEDYERYRRSQGAYSSPL